MKFLKFFYIVTATSVLAAPILVRNGIGHAEKRQGNDLEQDTNDPGEADGGGGGGNSGGIHSSQGFGPGKVGNGQNSGGSGGCGNYGPYVLPCDPICPYPIDPSGGCRPNY
jgi:hypothetical protein